MPRAEPTDCTWRTSERLRVRKGAEKQLQASWRELEWTHPVRHKDPSHWFRFFRMRDSHMFFSENPGNPHAFPQGEYYRFHWQLSDSGSSYWCKRSRDPAFRKLWSFQNRLRACPQSWARLGKQSVWGGIASRPHCAKPSTDSIICGNWSIPPR